MRRSLLALGALPFAAAALFPVGSHGSQAIPLAGSTLTFVKVEVDPTGSLVSFNWNAGQGTATASPPFGTATYQYPLPSTIPPAGASVTLRVVATAIVGSRFAPRLGLGGDIDIQDGPAEVGALAESGQTATGEKTVKLVPRRYANGAEVKITVGLQDGPRVIYTYRASNPPTAGCRRQQSVASAGAACLKSFRFQSAAHHPDNIRTPTGHSGFPWHVHAASFGKVVLLSYYQAVREDDRKPVRRGAQIEADVEDTQLVVSGKAKVLRLAIVVRENRKSPLFDKLLPCREGTRGTVVVVDDQRLMTGGDPSQQQTRDKVIVNVPGCSYLSHTISNADSHSHKPFIGGPGAFSGRGGGQWAIVRVTTTG